VLVAERGGVSFGRYIVNGVGRRDARVELDWVHRRAEEAEREAGEDE
jgi:hypothetical protein